MIKDCAGRMSESCIQDSAPSTAARGTNTAASVTAFIWDENIACGVSRALSEKSKRARWRRINEQAIRNLQTLRQRSKNADVAWIVLEMQRRPRGEEVLSDTA